MAAQKLGGASSSQTARSGEAGSTTKTDDVRLVRMSRRFRVACLLGALAGLAVVLLLLSAAHVGPSTRHYSDDFFDAQARSWLSGKWDVPPEVVGGEGFDTPKGTQIYFGIAPSLLRLPILAFAHVDGQLVVLSELAALTLLLVAASRLAWTVRSLFAPGKDAPEAGWYPAVVGGLFVALIGAGSSATFLASQPTVFAETILWAAAFMVASSDQFVRFLRAPTMTRALTATLLAGAALNTRITTGLGAILPVVVVALVALMPSTWALRRKAAGLVPDPQRFRRFALPMLAVVTASFVVCFGANWARFGHPWKIPYEKQIVFRFDPDRLAAFRASSGPFSPTYAGTDVITYFRPDGIRPTPFPVVTYSDPRDTIVVNAPPNIVEPTASVAMAMSGLLLLSLAGGAAMIHRVARQRLVRVRLSVIGAAIPAIFILNYTSLAHRYTGDFLPLLVLLGTVGAARVAEISVKARQRVAVGGLVALAVWGTWVTVGLTMWTNEHNAVRNRAALESWVTRLADLQAPFARGPVIPQPSQPPKLPTGWDLMARPDCARVYTAYFNGWYAFERAPGTGAFHRRASPPPADGVTYPLTRTADGKVLVGLRTTQSDTGAVTTAAFSRDGGVSWSYASSIRGMRADGTRAPTALPIDPEGQIDLVIDYDWFTGTVTASGDSNDTFLMINEPLPPPEQAVALAPGFPGTVTEINDPAPRCPQWTSPR